MKKKRSEDRTTMDRPRFGGQAQIGPRRCARQSASSCFTKPTDFVFPTTTGAQQGKDNVRNRILALAIKRANQRREEADQPPLPEGLTLHSLRHTFASLLVALGEDPRYVMSQLGHTDPGFTIRVYTHSMRRDEGEKDRLRLLIEGANWAQLGTNRVPDPSDAPTGTRPRTQKTPPGAGHSTHGRGWFRTSDLSRVKRALSH
jgi:integrase